MITHEGENRKKYSFFLQGPYLVTATKGKGLRGNDEGSSHPATLYCGFLEIIISILALHA